MPQYFRTYRNNLFLILLLLALTSCFESSSDSGSTSASATSILANGEPVGFTRPCLGSTQVGTGTCSDGLDNDGDGLVDWMYDLGCSGPNDTEVADCRDNEDGWTTYDPHPTETEIIYVSSSGGDDAYNGLYPDDAGNGSDGPLKTVAAAIALVRNNSADWVLFKRGDTWTDESVGRGLEDFSGISPENPIVLASYGDSIVRPKFDYSGTVWYGPVGGTPENISLLGLEINQYQLDPNNSLFNPRSSAPAISWLAAGGNFLLEDCKITYAQVNLQNYNAPTGYFEVRRNVLTHSYSINSHAQSIFTSVNNPLIIEGNVMNHGGWNDDFRLVLTDPQIDSGVWGGITDGCFDIDLMGRNFQVSGVDFSGVVNMDAVAQVLEDAVNDSISATSVQPDTIAVDFTLGGVFKITSTDFTSDDAYGIALYTGGAGGTDISGSNYLNSAASGVPESTIFNRNMYLSHGFGNTLVRGNIDANGASGGVQLRMGGFLDNNLYLQNPIAMIIGSSQNDSQNVSALVRNNVVLGARNIDTQRQGKGIGVGSYLAGSGYGPSWVENVEIYNNIIANIDRAGLGNIRGIEIAGDAPHINLDIHHNIVYNWTNTSWPNPLDHRAFAFVINDLNPSTTNSFFRNNIIQQPASGYIGASVTDQPLTLENNSYYSAEADSDITWSQGWFAISGFNTVTSGEWQSLTNDASVVPAAPHVFSDPSRTIASYHSSISGGASFDAFIAQALLQSRLDWDSRYTANAVNTWIREGFDLTYEQ